jgi:hypothetical protein
MIDRREALIELRRLQASVAARKLVDGLSRDITDIAPVRLTLASRPIWTRLSKRRDPFKVTSAQVESWFNDIVATHPPLVIKAETAKSQTKRRAGAAKVA